MTTDRLQMKWIFTASLLNNTGNSLLWPLTTVYMHNYLHQTMTMAGIVMFLLSMSMMIGNYVGGWLFDHWKPYMAAVLPVTLATIATVLLAIFDQWPAFAVWLCLISFADGASLTVINSYGTAVPTHSSRYVFNLLYMALNIGVVIGTLLVGVLLPIGPHLVFGVSAAIYVAFLILTILTFNVKLERGGGHHARHDQSKHDNKRGIRVVYALCLCFVTLYLSYVLWESIMSVRITDMHIPFFAYSLLWTVNGGLIMIFQPLMNNLAGYISTRVQVILGLSIFAFSFLPLIFAHTFTMFLIDFIILTIGEMMGVPSVPAYIDELTDPLQAGKYQGMTNIAMSIGRAIGPLYGGLIIDYFSYEALFLSVFAMMALSILYMAVVSRHQAKQK
jgi:MFS family permease